MQLNERSLRNLEGVHPDLIRVVKRAAEITPVPFVVTEGLRNLERQKELKAAGKSWTLDSRHLTGHAVDVVDADNFGYDMPDLTEIAKAMRSASAEFKVPIKWGANVKFGGDFKSVNDSPHFELDSAAYPASGVKLGTKVKEWTEKVVLSKPALAAGGVVSTAVSTADPTPVPVSSIPVPPDLTAVSAWHSFGQTVSTIEEWANAHPWIALVIAAWVGSVIFWDRIKAFVGRVA